MIENLTQLLWNDETEKLLFLCGMEDEIGEDRSDYERFTALCRAIPLLKGNRAPTRWRELLWGACQISFPLSEENAPKIWENAANRFFDGEIFPVPVNPTVGNPPLTDFPKPVNERSVRVPSFFFRDNFNVEDWQKELHAWVKSQKENALIVLTLPESYRMTRPDLYHVSLALDKRIRTPIDTNLLLTQAFRELCGCLAGTDARLLLRAECPMAEAVALVSYGKSKVGLPSVMLNFRDRGAILSAPDTMYEAKICRSVRLAVCAEDFSGGADLRAVVTSLCTVYPFGRIILLNQKP